MTFVIECHGKCHTCHDIFSYRAVHESQDHYLEYDMSIYQGDLTLPTHELYSFPKYREMLKKFILRVVKLLQKDDPRAHVKSKEEIEKQVEDLVEFEKALGKVTHVIACFDMLEHVIIQSCFFYSFKKQKNRSCKGGAFNPGKS